jgi:hypothetical protein
LTAASAADVRSIARTASACVNRAAWSARRSGSSAVTLNESGASPIV